MILTGVWSVGGMILTGGVKRWWNDTELGVVCWWNYTEWGLGAWGEC
jgi:hypothetical protein